MLKCLGAVDRTVYSSQIVPRDDCVLALNVPDPNMLLAKDLKTAHVTVTGCRNVQSQSQRTVFRIERLLCFLYLMF